MKKVSRIRGQTGYIYRYDGTFPGFLCCVAQTFFDKSLPLGIEERDNPQATLFPVREVGTRPDLAARLERSIREKISPLAWDMLRRGYLTCMDRKEMCLLRFVLLGYRTGPRVTRLATHPDVDALNKALLFLKNEAHYEVEFLRFSDFGEFLGAVITPKNTVLPLIAGHFCQRFNTENFMIYEKTHQLGFVYRRGGQREFFHADTIQLPPFSAEEREYRALWRTFYDAIAVEGRINPALRRGHMPMRYWENMTEFQQDNQQD